MSLPSSGVQEGATVAPAANEPPIGEMLAQHSFRNVAAGGKDALVESIFTMYERIHGAQDALQCIENDRCLLVGTFLELHSDYQKSLWSKVASLSIGKPLTRSLIKEGLLLFHEKELFALLGIALHSYLHDHGRE
jgi:hypothetical protein